MAPPVAAVRNPQLLLCRGGLLHMPTHPNTLPFAARTARARLAPPRFSLFPIPKSLSSASSQIPVCSLFIVIVEEVGRVRLLGPLLSPSAGGGEAPGLDLEVETKDLIVGTQLEDSVAVDGTCLTVVAIDVAASTLTFSVAPETLRRTSLGSRSPGDGVNLERTLTPSSRMDGHFVQGHVDGTDEIVAFRPTVSTPTEIVRLLVPKGFVAVDSTSLTVCNVDDFARWFNFMLVRYTQDNIVLPIKKVGDKVNLEADILGKYVEKLHAGRMEVMSKTDS